MRRSCLCGGFLAALLIVAGGAGGARAAELSVSVFSDWNYYNNAAWRAADRGDLPEAIRRFHLAMEVLRPEWDRAPKLMARSYADVAWALYRQGRAEEALPLAQWALEVRLQYFGPDSEPVAQSLYELAMIELDRTHYAEAESLLRRSISAWEKRVGPYDLRVSFYLMDLARVLIAERKLDEAESIYRRVLGQPERALPPKHPYRVVSLIGLGAIYTAKGEPVRAGFQNNQLIPLLQTLSHTDALEVAEPLDRYLVQLRLAGRAEDMGLLETVAQPIVKLVHNDATVPPKPFRRTFPASPGTTTPAPNGAVPKSRPG